MVTLGQNQPPDTHTGSKQLRATLAVYSVKSVKRTTSYTQRIMTMNLYISLQCLILSSAVPTLQAREGKKKVSLKCIKGCISWKMTLCLLVLAEEV